MNIWLILFYLLPLIVNVGIIVYAIWSAYHSGETMEPTYPQVLGCVVMTICPILNIVFMVLLIACLPFWEKPAFRMKKHD